MFAVGLVISTIFYAYKHHRGDPVVATMTAARARGLLSRSVTEAVAPLGFKQVRATSWVREQDGLHRVIGIATYHGRRSVQWGVVVPEAVPVIWGREAKYGDVAWSVVSGETADVVETPHSGAFVLPDGVEEREVHERCEAVAADAAAVARWLGRFATTGDVTDFVLGDPHEGVVRPLVIPGSLAMRLFTGAVLSALRGDPGAPALLARTEVAFEPFQDSESRAQLQRLRAVAQMPGN